MKTQTKTRKPRTDAKIAKLREKIDAATREMLFALKKRTTLAREIGKIKAKAGLPVLDSGREKSVLASAEKTARSLGLQKNAGASIARLCIKIARAEEKVVLHQKKL